MKALVTGGSGFIGSKLTQRLKANGLEVFNFDNAGGIVSNDLRYIDSVLTAVKGKDYVFHLAAVADLNWAKVHPIEAMQINVQGTWNVAYACQQYGAKLYYASTCCVYGNQPVHPETEEMLPRPAEIYACSKMAGENVIMGFHHTYGLEYNMMRFATIYGEGTRPALATHIFLRQAITGQPITVHGEGKQTRTLTYIDDLVDAIEMLFLSSKVNGVWNMSTEEEVSALQMAQDIRQVTGSNSKIEFIPQRVGQTFKESISAKKMKEEVGWKAKTKWHDGIRKMHKWFVDTNQVTQIYKIPE